MNIFDLLFLIGLLCTVGVTTFAVWQYAHGRVAVSLSLLRRLLLGLCGYAACVLLASIVTPQRYTAIGDASCSDDWCLTVTQVNARAMTDSVQFDVGLQIESRARGTRQREKFVTVFLQSAAGERFNPRTVATDVPFDTLLAPGQSVHTKRSFVIPSGAAIDGLVIAREGGGRFPRCCVIGDNDSFLHKRRIIKLQPGA